MTLLWLIRHPEPEPSANGKCYGSSDIKLSPAGMRHAGAIARALRGHRFDAIYSSPSRRCMETAAKIAAGRPCAVQPVDALRELDFGELEGRSYDEIAALFPALYRDWMERPTETEFPDGETFRQLCARVLGASRGLVAQHEDATIVFVTHGGPIRIILADALGAPLSNIFRIAQCYGAINRVCHSEDAVTVDVVNLTLRRFRLDAHRTLRCLPGSQR